MYEEHYSDFFQFRIIGIGKSQYSSLNSNFTNAGDLPVVIDETPYNTWSNWGASQRDLIFLDKNGEHFCTINITSGINEQDILDKISHLFWNTTAYVETDIEILGDNNIYTSESTFNLLITETNLSDFDSHYTGYSLSSNSPYIEFSLDENWFYVIFSGETYTDNSSFTILDNAPMDQEITIYVEPNWMDCNSDSCDECDIDCRECISGGESEITFTIQANEECTDGEIIDDNPCNPMECWGGQWYEIIIDCQEEMGVPCEEGEYIPPDEGECCSVCVLSGDVNGDNLVNVLDVVMLVNHVLESEYIISGDLNNDGSLDVLDVVSLVNLIIN